MTESIRAICENGVFRPLDTPNLPEHQQVRLTVESIVPSTQGKTETDRIQEPEGEGFSMTTTLFSN